MIEMDPDSQAELDTKIAAASMEDRYMENKLDIIEYYRDNYRESTWRSQLTKDMLGALGLADTKKNRNTISRQIQGDRLYKDARTAKTKDAWRALGKLLPPTQVPRNLRGKRAVVTVTVWLKFSKGRPKKKEFTRILSREQTQQLLEEGGIDAIIEAYEINPDDVEYADGLTIDIEFID